MFSAMALTRIMGGAMIAEAVIRRAAIRYAIVAILGFAVDPAHAVSRQTLQEEAKLAECIREAASDRPWLEKTLWGLRDQEAGWVGAEVRNTDGSHDLGPLQVNSWWVVRIAKLVRKPPATVRYWLINDVCFNVQAARWIFLSGLTLSRDYWIAVGTYHSPTPWRQRRYALEVSLRLRRRFGAEIFGVAKSPQAGTPAIPAQIR